MTDREPIVSVGMPVRNSSRWLGKSLDSLLSQTLTDYEIIISDNASSDDTFDIIREYATADSRIRYVRQPHNIGVNGNYNAVVDLARGRYFKWASSNDLCKPTFLEECVDILRARPDVVLCYPRTMLIGEDDEELGIDEDNLNIQDDSPVERFVKFIDRVNHCNPINGVVRPEPLRWAGHLKDYVSSDYPFLAGLLLWGKFYELPSELFLRRFSPSAQAVMKKKANEPNDYLHDEEFVVVKRFIDYYDMVRRSPIRLDEKIRLYASLTQHLFWESKYITVELRHALASILPVSIARRLLAGETRHG